MQAKPIQFGTQVAVMRDLGESHRLLAFTRGDSWSRSSGQAGLQASRFLKGPMFSLQSQEALLWVPPPLPFPDPSPWEERAAVDPLKGGVSPACLPARERSLWKVLTGKGKEGTWFRTVRPVP